MYWNKLIPELAVSNLQNSLKFYKTAGFKIEYDSEKKIYKAVVREETKGDGEKTESK